MEANSPRTYARGEISITSLLDGRHVPSEEGILELIRRTDAFNNCRVRIMDAVKPIGGDPRMWNDIRKYVFPVLRAEGERLHREYKSHKKALGL